MKGYRAVRCFIAACSLIAPAEAVVFFSTGDPHYNTTPPSGDLAGSGWEMQGDALPGIPIRPNFFITATHLGAKVGDTFAFHGAVYPMVASFLHPDADITIFQVNGSFPQYAELYTSSDEVGKPLVVFGRGAERGTEIWLNGRLKGWAWGSADGLLRWGENIVAGISDQDGNPATTETKFRLLRADFDQNGGPTEAHLSGGDSGGGVFIREGGVWKLAGVNHAANKDYSTTEGGDGFTATLFDEGGFWEGEPGKRQFHPDDPAAGPQPGSFYATRISAYVPWIQSIIGGGDTAFGLSLEAAPNLLGPYAPVPGANVDPGSMTITIPRPPETHFYRIFSDRPHAITAINQLGEQVVLTYQ